MVLAKSSDAPGLVLSGLNGETVLHQDTDLQGRLQSLDRLFRPRSIALVGASDRSIWSVSAFDNLKRAGFEGRVVPVNPKGGVIHGVEAATSIAAIGEPIDAALLMVPEAVLGDTLQDLKTAGVGGAVILSAGFAETGEDGVQRQAALTAAAREAGIRILGPNCLGFANFADGAPIWTTPLRRPMPNPTLAVVSQSGALASQMEQFAYQQRIALTHMISTGNEADVTIADAIEYLAHRSEARAIALFLETVRDPVAFARAVEAANAAGKAVVVLKVGTSEAAAAAAQAHTGSLVGDDRVFDALCRRLGVVRVKSLEELVVTADVIGRVGKVERPGLAMLAMSGGLCEIAVDQAEVEGLFLPTLAPATLTALREALPSYATPNNPLDTTGAAMTQPDLIAEALRIVSNDPSIGMVSFVFDAPAKADARGFAARFIDAVGQGIKDAATPGLMFSHTFSPVSAEGRGMTDSAGVAYSGGGLRHALTAIGHLFRWSSAKARPLDLGRAAGARPEIGGGERGVLDYLASHGVPVIPGVVATSDEQAVETARTFDSMAVLKIASPDIPHKTEVGGVALRLSGDEAVAEAYADIRARVAAARPDARIDGVIVSPMRSAGVELFVGTLKDPQWGPAIAVGLGGVFVEALKDTSLRLLPITEADALEMMDELRGKALLDGFRGAAPVDRAAAARAIVAIGEAALALGSDLMSLEVNPLLADGDRIEALDGLVIWEDSHEHA